MAMPLATKKKLRSRSWAQCRRPAATTSARRVVSVATECVDRLLPSGRRRTRCAPAPGDIAASLRQRTLRMRRTVAAPVDGGPLQEGIWSGSHSVNCFVYMPRRYAIGA